MTPEAIACIVFIAAIFGTCLLMLALLWYASREDWDYGSPVAKDKSWVFTFRAKVKDMPSTIYCREVFDGTQEEVEPRILDRVAEMQAIVFQELKDRKLTDDDVEMKFEYSPF